MDWRTWQSCTHFCNRKITKYQSINVKHKSVPSDVAASAGLVKSQNVQTEDVSSLNTKLGWLLGSLYRTELHSLMLRLHITPSVLDMVYLESGAEAQTSAGEINEVGKQQGKEMKSENSFREQVQFFSSFLALEIKTLPRFSVYFQNVLSNINLLKYGVSYSFLSRDTSEVYLPTSVSPGHISLKTARYYLHMLDHEAHLSKALYLSSRFLPYACFFGDVSVRIMFPE